MTRKEYNDKWDALEEYYSALSRHRENSKSFSNSIEKFIIFQNENKGIEDMQSIIDYTREQIDNQIRNLMPNYTKRKLLAIKHARDNGYLTQKQIEY